MSARKPVLPLMRGWVFAPYRVREEERAAMEKEIRAAEAAVREVQRVRKAHDGRLYPCTCSTCRVARRLDALRGTR